MNGNPEEVFVIFRVDNCVCILTFVLKTQDLSIPDESGHVLRKDDTKSCQ